MKAYDNYIFDLYGTLVDIHTEENDPLVWKKLALFYGYYDADYSSEELKERYSILIEFKYIKKEVLLDFSMIKRMINNLCSNIQKYSDKHVDMTLTLDDSFDLLLTNKKKSDLSKVESNKIGLKSVKRIVELHEGACSIEDSEKTFSIHISIPLKKA